MFAAKNFQTDIFITVTDCNKECAYFLPTAAKTTSTRPQ